MMNCWFLTAEICWKLIAEFAGKYLPFTNGDQGRQQY
jgi:hypothetical protein